MEKDMCKEIEKLAKDCVESTKEKLYYRIFGLIYAKFRFRQERMHLEMDRTQRLKKLYERYLTQNLKKAEEKMGMNHNEDAYKTLLTIKNNKAVTDDDKTKKFSTKLLELKYQGYNGFYVGYVNKNNQLHGEGTLILEKSQPKSFKP